MKNYKNIKRTHNKLPKFAMGLNPNNPLGGLFDAFGGYHADMLTKDGYGYSAADVALTKSTLNYIDNNTLTKVPKSNTVKTDKVGNIAGTAIQFAGSAINSFGNNKSSQKILNESGQLSKQVMGVGYDYQNGPDEAKQWSDLKRLNFGNTLATAGSGAALGFALGGPIGGIVGGVVGIATGLFGSKSRANKLRKQMLNARRTAEARNTYAYSGAMSTGMQNEYYQENGDTDNSILYANKGKDLPMYNTGKDSSPWVKVGKNTKVWSPTDYAGQIANAKVGLGESLVDFKNRTASFVSKGKGVGVDDQYAKVDEDTFIAGNDRSWKDGMTFAEKALSYTLAVQDLNKGLKDTQKNIEKSSLAANTVKFINKRVDSNMNNLQEIAKELKEQHDMLNRYNMFYANRGRDLMRCKRGTDTNALVSPWQLYTAHLPAALGGLHLIIDSGKEQQVLDTYRANPYAGLALNTLAKNRPNPYNQLRAVDDSERRALYSLRGLNGALRAQSGIAGILGAGANRANIYAANEDKMNQYRSSLASMASTLGAQEQQARMSAANIMRQDIRDNSKISYDMLNKGWLNMSNAYEQTVADKFKINMAQRQLDMYNQILSNDQKNALNRYNP